MLISSFQGLSVSGMSVAMPTTDLSVDFYKDSFGAETVDKFSEMTGVKSVCRAIPEQTAGDLGYEAARHLITQKEVDPEKIGLLVFVTQKPDYRAPSTAFVIHKRLGLSRNCMCFDINLACSGFIYGLNLVYSMLASSDATTALLITGDTSVRTISPHDRTMIMLFGDCGSATLIEKSDQNSHTHFTHRTDGNRFKAIITPSGAYRNMGASHERVLWSDGILRSDYDINMKGMEVFGFSITDVPKLIKEFMDHLAATSDDYDCFALHQANIYILKQIARKIKIPPEKMPVSLDLYGNTSSNSIPMTLSETYAGKEKRDIRLLMCGFGAGLSWACADLVINTGAMLPPIRTDAFYAEGVL